MYYTGIDLHKKTSFSNRMEEKVKNFGIFLQSGSAICLFVLETVDYIL